MEFIYETDVKIIEILQTRLLQFDNVLISISNIFDPRYAFLLYTPFVFAIDRSVGRKLMWVVVISEWINHVLKWVVQGERPYWWVHEADVYNGTGALPPTIYQFSLTCETGPGNPSGHSQSTAAVWYMMCNLFLQKYSAVEKRGMTTCIFTGIVYVLLLATIATSRVFIAAHFPHQCIFGMILGWLIARKLRNINVVQVSIRQYSSLTAGMFVSALAVYGMLHAIGHDPKWTMERALKWCARPENVHMDTTPFFAMMRYCGFMFGMGFGFNSRGFSKCSTIDFTVSMKMASACISIGVCLLSDAVSLSKESMPFFYFQAFALYAFLAYVMIAAVPNIVVFLCEVKEKKT